MKKLIIFLTILIFSVWCVANVGAQSLRSLAEQLKAKGHEFYIGCAVPSNFSSADQTIVKTEFNIVTCENNMKIGTISPSQGQYNYSGGDSLVSFAQSNTMAMHGHCFIWHKYNPGWVTGTKSMMETYISAVGAHFKGKIYIWDVVNESFQRDGTYRINAIGSGGQDGASVYGQQQGKQYIEDAFRAAAKADPNAKLMYNDYSIETLDAKFNGMYAMLQDFKNRSVPLHAVGFQMHVGPDFTEAMAQGFAAKMQKVADLGYESWVTEMDGGAPDTSAAGLQKQSDIYYWITKACLSVSLCRGLQVWGIRDSQSWRINPDDPVDRAVAPLIFDDNGNKKPAYYGIQKALQEAVNGTPEPTPAATPTGMLGDVNGNGSIEITDALLIAQYYVGMTPSVFITTNADVNRDSSITIVDALKVAQCYVGLISCSF
jgi:GH35 family endo-1,4-beta-xylanase